jgi:hypothetical protein
MISEGYRVIISKQTNINEEEMRKLWALKVGGVQIEEKEKRVL